MLTDIEIIDYKCFKNFKLEGLSRINIISGENNVGKTALLEALFLYGISQNKHLGSNGVLFPLSIIAKNRDINNKQFKKFIEHITYKANSNYGEVEFKSKNYKDLNDDELNIVNKLNSDYNTFLFSMIQTEIDLLPIDTVNMKAHSLSYINSSKPKNSELVRLYSRIQTQGKQHKFLEYLKILDNNIAWIEPQLIDDEFLLRINLKNPEHSLISSELGEGTNRYIEILATLLSNTSQLIYIDEIENGIHYSKLKDIWKAIIEIVQKENIQLFVTTHDKESIEALIEASKESKYKDISSIQLYKDDTNTIVPIVLQYENFAYGINRGADVR